MQVGSSGSARLRAQAAVSLIAVLLLPASQPRAEPAVTVINAQSVEPDRGQLPSVTPTAPHLDWPVTPSVASAAAPAPLPAGVAEVVNVGPSAPVVAIAAKADELFKAPIERRHAGTQRVMLTRYNRKIVRAVGDAPEPVVKIAAMPAVDPAFNLVECIAGCGDAVRKVVYYAPRLSTLTGLPFVPGGQKTIAVAAPAPIGSDAAVITCVAGCYDGPKSYVARPAPASLQRASLEPNSMTAPLSSGQMTQTAAVMSAVEDAPKAFAAQVKPRKPRQRHIAKKRMKPMQWRTVVRQASVTRAVQPRGWTTVVRY